MSPFGPLMRFESDDGHDYYGKLHIGMAALDLVGTEICIYNNGVSETVLAAHIYGVGLNYKAHAEEANLPMPEYPMIFSKPADALAGPYDDIQVENECTLMDYECELAVIIGKDCKNIPETENPLDYVLGYCAANDFSSRYWQMPERAGQAGYAKGFDKFAPIGPVLVSPRVIPGNKIGNLRMTTKVNGEQRQTTLLNDMIFDVGKLIRHLCRGMTLRKFTVILTGTPNGVGALMKPSSWLKDVHSVTVDIEGIGTIENRLEFL